MQVHRAILLNILQRVVHSRKHENMATLQELIPDPGLIYREAWRALWLHSNETFVSAAEQRVSVYLGPAVYLTLGTGAGVGTGEPQSENACGSFSDGY